MKEKGAKIGKKNRELEYCIKKNFLFFRIYFLKITLYSVLK